MSDEKTSQIGTLLITGLLAILGTVAGGVIKGYWDNTLADKKFQADLVMRALEADEQESRIDSLSFMIKANLIADPAIKDGVQKILRESPETVPQIRASTIAYTPGVVVPSTEQTVGFTDFNVFVCDVSWESASAKSTSTAIIDALHKAGQVGQIALKPWDLYDEIPLESLRNKITIVVDMEHGEASELPRLKRVLENVEGLPDIQVVENPGRTSTWLISLVVCPTG
jgi:hypothetical protein